MSRTVVLGLFLLLPGGLAGTCLAVEPDTDQQEAILADFSNVRGLNYIASYAPSDVAMWRLYDHDVIDRELGYVAGLGANSVRVWLAWVVYDVEGEKFIDKFRDFLSLAERHNLTVMPILWDSCFGDEQAGYDDLEDWVANPGWKRVQDKSFRTQGDEYVRAVVEAGKDSPAVLMWDMMNEPGGPGINSWLEHYCKLVKSIDPDNPVTIGWAHASSNETSGDWVDVMSYHPYGIFDRNRDLWTEAVRKASASHGNKPILVTEVGGSGWGQRYERAIDYFDNKKIGYYLFEAMIGSNRFRRFQGIVFPDGTVREMGPVTALQAHARKHGVHADGKFELKTGGEGYVTTNPKTDVADVKRIILNWNDLEIGPANQEYYRTILQWTMISLAWAKALSPEDGQSAQELRAEAAKAEKTGDVKRVKHIYSNIAALAAKRLREHGFVSAPK